MILGTMNGHPMFLSLFVKDSGKVVLRVHPRQRSAVSYYAKRKGRGSESTPGLPTLPTFT